MNAQLEFPLDPPGYPPGFHAWAAANPHIVEAFLELSLRAKRGGLRRWSSDAAVHVLRFETALREAGECGFKINNNRTAGLARLAMEREPGLHGFFEIRTKREAA